jgi:hypothetical protein
MIYIKTYEKYNKKTVDYNTIYTMNIHNDKGKNYSLIGKMIPRDYGTLLKGYVEDRSINKFVGGKSDWSKIREATPEEIAIYNALEDSKKYNL